MAYKNLGSIVWGSGPNITGSIAYDYQRSGADMQYKVKVTIHTLPYSDSYFGYPIYATIRLDGTAKVTGHRIKAASPSVWEEALVYETGWLTVSGKSSGTTALSVNLYSGSGEDRDKTYSYALYVVPAASSMSFDAFTMGSAGAITVSRAGSSYTHTISYTFGEASGTIVTKSAGTSVSWTPPLDLAQQISNATQATGVLRIDTYSGNTKIGSKEYNFTLYVPASIKPTAALAVTLVNDNSVIDGWNVCVKGYSKLSYTVTAGGAYGATIQSCRFSFAGKSVTGSSGIVAVNSAGTFAPGVEVTDSRGRSVSVTGDSIDVYDYNAPTIAQLSVQRCNAEGTVQNEGTYVCVQGAFHVGASVGGRNGVTAKCRYREIGGSWSSYTTIEGASAVVGGSMSATKTYEMEIAATDSIGETKTVSVIIPTAEVTLHLRDGGKGAAFGKYAEQEALECAWDAVFGGNVVVGDACIGQDGQISGTRLRSTAHSDLGAAPESYPVFHDGWLYSRTLAEMREDLKVNCCAITVRPGNQQTLSKSAAIISCGTVCDLVGTKLSISSDGGVVCNANGHILISASSRVTGLTAGDRVYIRYRHKSNDVDSDGYGNPTDAMDTVLSATITPILRSVQAGDIIYLIMYNSVAARGNIAANESTYLTVQYIDQ